MSLKTILIAGIATAAFVPSLSLAQAAPPPAPVSLGAGANAGLGGLLTAGPIAGVAAGIGLVGIVAAVGGDSASTTTTSTN